MLKEKSCGALVYRKRKNNIDILILKHILGNHWSFPKGHVENDETEIETALREIKEETNLNVKLVDGFRHVVTYSPAPGIKKDVVYFLAYAEDSDTKVQEEEISEIRWVPLEKSEDFLTYQNDRQILRNAKLHMKSKGIV